MSVSSIRAISILLLLASYTLADLPSCARAKCVHCEVNFIARNCPTACDVCKTPHQSVQVENNQRPPQPPPAFTPSPSSSISEHSTSPERERSTGLETTGSNTTTTTTTSTTTASTTSSASIPAATTIPTTSSNSTTAATATYSEIVRNFKRFRLFFKRCFLYPIR
uniref:ShKT domain-containing protein n=1 Tax=Caenorhabditis tropicalis TaxID=1561998 RepID=A0A1I7UC63_9PELO